MAGRRRADDRRRGEVVRLAGRPGPRGRARRSSTTTSPGGSQNEIYELRRGDLHCAMRIPPPSAPAPRDEGIVREWRIIEALGGTDVPHTEAIAVCTDQSVLGRTFYLMGFVDGWSPMSTRRQWPAPFDTDLDGTPGAGVPARRGHRPAVAGGLEGQGPRRPRPPGRLPRAAGRPLDRVPGADQGPRAARLRRGRRVAAGAPAARLHPRADARRLPVRQRHVQARRAGAARRDRRLGDGHRRRPQARPGLGRALLAGRHHRRRGPRRRLRRHDRHAVARRAAGALRRASPAARSTTSTTTASSPSGSWPSCSSRATSGAGNDEKLQAFGPIVLDLMQSAADLAESTPYSVLATA